MTFLYKKNFTFGFDVENQFFMVYLIDIFPYPYNLQSRRKFFLGIKFKAYFLPFSLESLIKPMIVSLLLFVFLFLLGQSW